MKKNISVNLFGTLYNIDEDAYNLLQQYEESVRSYFKRKGEDDEVALDIESRVAELFEELRLQGIEAITIEHVQDIIRRIGEPRQMDGDAQEGEEQSEATDKTEQKPQEESEAQADEAPQPAPRKLYRDPDDCMLGGVLSGLAHYFGGSATALRLLFVIIALFVASIPWLIVFYLICCILIPKAATTEDKLRMMGKPVNLVSLGEGVINGVDQGVQPAQQRGCVGQLLGFIALMFKVAIFLCFGFFALFVGIMLFCVICVMLIALAASVPSFMFDHPSVFTGFDLPFGIFSDIGSGGFWIMIVSLLTLFGLPLYAIVHLYRRMRGTEQPWSTAATVAAWLLWLIAAGLVACLAYGTLRNLDERHFRFNVGPYFNVTRTVSRTITVVNDSLIVNPIDDADSDTIAVSDTIY